MKLKSLHVLLFAGTVALGTAPALAEEVVTWQMWAGDTEIAAWEEVARIAEGQLDGIKIELKTAPWPEYWTKLPILAASGQVADVVAMQSLRVNQFTSIMVPLDDLIAKDSDLKLADFDTSIIEGMSDGGHLYGLPYDVGPLVTYYNKTALEAAGIALPQIGWTYDNFLKTAIAATREGNYGFGTDAWQWDNFTVAIGAHFVDKDRNLDLGNPTAIDSFTKYVELFTKHKVAPIFAPGSADTVFGSFLAGKVAMTFDGPWSAITLKNDAKFEVGMTTLPRGEGDLQAGTAGSGFGVSTNAKNPEAAWKVVKALTSPEALAHLAKAGRALPARSAEQKYWYEVAAKGIYNGREALDYSFAHAAWWQVPSDAVTYGALQAQHFPLAFTGDVSPEDTLKTVQSLAAN